MFCLSIHIESFSKDIFSKLKKDNYLRGLDKDAFVVRIAELLADINALHPFREGNGRAQRDFIRYILCADTHAKFIEDFSLGSFEEIPALELGLIIPKTCSENQPPRLRGV